MVRLLDAAQFAVVLVQWMGGDVEAERLLLELEQILLWPFLDRFAQGQRRRFAALAEQADLIVDGVGRGALRDLESVVDLGDQRCAQGAGEIKGAALDQRFEHAAVEQLGADAHAEIRQDS